MGTRGHQKKNHSYRNGQRLPSNRTRKGGKKQGTVGRVLSTLEKEKTVEKAEKFFKL